MFRRLAHGSLTQQTACKWGMQDIAVSGHSCLPSTRQIYLLECCTSDSMCLQDEGADIDVSALLLPEPGLASDALEVQAEPASASVMALDVAHEQNGALGAADADETDEGFGEQLAVAGKVTG